MPWARKRSFSRRVVRHIYRRAPAYGKYVSNLGVGLLRGMASQPTTKRKGMTSGQGVTFENDRSRIYRKKRMPRRRRRRWVRKIRLNNAIDQTRLGTRTVVMNKLDTYGNSTLGNHGLAWATLYGGDSLNTVNKDIVHMRNLENAGDQTAAAGDTTYNSTKYFFKSAVLDMTIRNVSSLILYV